MSGVTLFFAYYFWRVLYRPIMGLFTVIFIIIVIIAVLVMYYVYHIFISVAGALDPAHTIGTIPKCPANWEDDKAALCKQCPAGYKSDGGLMCYGSCGANWPGTETVAHCQKAATYSPAKVMVSQCPSGTTSHDGMCYKNSDLGSPWYYSSPGLAKRDCPAGWRADGITCWLDADVKWQCTGDCPPGYVRTSVCTCGRGVQTTPQIKSVIGTVPPLVCQGGTTKIGALCYDTCQAGYHRTDDDLEYCTSICPDGTTDIGIGGCQKSTAKMTIKTKSDIGVCGPGTTLTDGMCKT
jgi:hypothetical protein